MVEHVSVACGFPSTPYLLGLLREQSTGHGVCVCFVGNEVCSEKAVEAGRGLVLKGDVLKWPFVCACLCAS